MVRPLTGTLVGLVCPRGIGAGPRNFQSVVFTKAAFDAFVADRAPKNEEPSK